MSGRSSPRPGVATCKFTPRKVKILGYNSGNNLIGNNKNNMLNGRFITRPSRVEETVKTVAEKKNSKKEVLESGLLTKGDDLNLKISK